MTCLLLTSWFLACESVHKRLMNSNNNYAIKETISVFAFIKKIMHMNNALLIDMLMLCNRKLKDATNQKWSHCVRFENIRSQLKISFLKWSLNDLWERLCTTVLAQICYHTIIAFSALSWVLFKKSLKTLCASLWKVSALLFHIITFVVEFSLIFCFMQTSTWQQFMSNASSFKIEIWNLWRISW